MSRCTRSHGRPSISWECSRPNRELQRRSAWLGNDQPLRGGGRSRTAGAVDSRRTLSDCAPGTRVNPTEFHLHRQVLPLWQIDHRVDASVTSQRELAWTSLEKPGRRPVW